MLHMRRSDADRIRQASPHRRIHLGLAGVPIIAAGGEQGVGTLAGPVLLPLATADDPVDHEGTEQGAREQEPEPLRARWSSPQRVVAHAVIQHLSFL